MKYLHAFLHILMYS